MANSDHLSPEKKRKTSSKHSDEGSKAKQARKQPPISPGETSYKMKPGPKAKTKLHKAVLDPEDFKPQSTSSPKKKAIKRRSPTKTKRQRSPSQRDDTHGITNSLSEDDPNHLWCICRKPYDDKFMIQCDKCADWFHGKCVNITKQKCKQFERANIEWFCPSCSESIQKYTGAFETISEDNLEEPEVKKKIIQTKGKSKMDYPKKNDLFSKNERKFVNEYSEECLVKNINNRQKGSAKGNQKHMRKSKGDIDTSKESNKSIDSNNQSLEIKELAFPLISQKLEKFVIPQKEKGLNQCTKTSEEKPRGQGKVLTAKKESSIREIPDGIFPTYHPRPITPGQQECVQCKKTKVATTSLYCSERCIEGYVAAVLSRKLSKVKNIVVCDRLSGRKLVGFSADKLLQWIKHHPTCEVLKAHKTGPNNAKVKSKKLPRKAENMSDVVSEAIPEEKIEPIRANVKKSLKECLWARCQETNENFSEAKIDALACKIEEELFNFFRDVGFKYKAKYRSLIFNIKDTKNNGLFQKIVKDIISPEKLVRMSSDELASQELAQWRERETKHTLEMIKKDQEDQINIPIMKKTHKGEVEIKEDRDSRNVEETSANEAPITVLSDTTSKHRYHLFDQNCNICTGKIAPPYPDEALTVKTRLSPFSISENQASGFPKKLPNKEGQQDFQSLKKQVNRCPLQLINYRAGTTLVWSGTIIMPGMAQFGTKAYQLSGPPAKEILPLEVPPTVTIRGKISPEQVCDYISKIKIRGTNDLLILQINPSSSQEMDSYLTFYKYLYKQKKYCMIDNAPSSMIKAFFLLPLASYSPIPTVLLPFDGHAGEIEGNHPPLFLGVLVRKKIHIQESIIQPNNENKDIAPMLSYTPPPAKMPEKTIVAGLQQTKNLSNATKSLEEAVCSHLMQESSTKQNISGTTESSVEDRWQDSPSPPPFRHHYRHHHRARYDPSWQPVPYYDHRRQNYHKYWRYHLKKHGGKKYI